MSSTGGFAKAILLDHHVPLYMLWAELGCWVSESSTVSSQEWAVAAKYICLSTLDIALTNTKAISFDLGF